MFVALNFLHALSYVSSNHGRDVTMEQHLSDEEIPTEAPKGEN